MKKYVSIILLVFATMLLISCEDSPPPPTCQVGVAYPGTYLVTYVPSAGTTCGMMNSMGGGNCGATVNVTFNPDGSLTTPVINNCGSIVNVQQTGP